ncbi:MAG: response regulator, partial [Opitutaceae bacterium]
MLVVDDEYGPRESIAFTLGREFNVATADRGRMALEMVRQTPYDAIVLDIRMPEMDGIRTLEELRRLDAHVAAIMLTGYGTLQTAQQAMAGGANQYLRKPPDVAELLESVRRQVAATRERRAQAAAALRALSLNEALRREIQEREPQIWQGKASVELVHDLNNPLSVVVGYSGLLADEARRLAEYAPKEAERLLAHAEVVAKAAQYCHHLADNWRGASKEAASFALVDLPVLVKEVLKVVLPGADAVVI